MSDEKQYTEREMVEREREAFMAGATWRFDRICEDDPQALRDFPFISTTQYQAAAAARYPLPKVTRPRVVSDPHGAGQWGARGTGTALAIHLVTSDGQWHKGGWAQIATKERVALWADLLANPTEEVDADV